MSHSRRRDHSRYPDTFVTVTSDFGMANNHNGNRREPSRGLLHMVTIKRLVILILLIGGVYLIYHSISSVKDLDEQQKEVDVPEKASGGEAGGGGRKRATVPRAPGAQKQRLIGPDDSGGLVYDKVAYATVPHTIHQMWKSHQVPRTFGPWIRSWVEMNPAWDYWFWTPQDIRALLKEHHPSVYTTTWEEYPTDVMRAEAARYYIMDTLGGLYADLDLECLRPCDPWADSHQCILTLEPEVHSRILSHRRQPSVINAMMASRPDHPFFRITVRALPDLIKAHPTSAISATGTDFLDGILGSYRNFSAEFRERQENAITVLSPEHFMSSFDPSVKRVIRERCEDVDQLDDATRLLCKKLAEEGYENEDSPMAFANHHWTHSFDKDQEFDSQDTVSIFDLVPNVKTFVQY